MFNCLKSFNLNANHVSVGPTHVISTYYNSPLGSTIAQCPRCGVKPARCGVGTLEHCRADVRIMRHCNLFTHPARAGQRPVSPDGGAYIILELSTRLHKMSQCSKKPFSGAVSLLKAPMLNLLLNICISKIGTVVQNCQFTQKAQLALS